MSKINNVTLGADPELFLQNELELVSAEGLIGGTKKHPLSIPDSGGCFIQENNVMVEFNIPPAKKVEDFVSSIEFMKEYIEVAASLNDCTISKLASGDFNPLYLQTVQSAAFGCEPDFNAHTSKTNKTVEAHGTLRTCGGHIHIGYNKPTTKTSVKIIKAMDLTLGLSSLSLDSDNRRRSMYGNAGAFRFKKYGVEYRTLSNFWIFSKEAMDWAFAGTMAAIEIVNNNILDSLYSEFGKQAVDCINNNKKEEAIEILIKINKIIKNKTICVEY